MDSSTDESSKGLSKGSGEDKPSTSGLDSRLIRRGLKLNPWDRIRPSRFATVDRNWGEPEAGADLL